MGEFLLIRPGDYAEPVVGDFVRIDPAKPWCPHVAFGAGSPVRLIFEGKRAGEADPEEIFRATFDGPGATSWSLVPAGYEFVRVRTKPHPVGSAKFHALLFQ